MRIKRLNSVLSKVLLAGCAGLFFSNTASAAYPGGYWQGVSPSFIGQYKFRPLNKPNARSSMPRYQQMNSMVKSPMHYAMGNFMAYSNMAGFNRMYRPSSNYRSGPPSPEQVLAENASYYNAYTPRFRPPPAFARQYGWVPARKMVVRKGGNQDHYASDSNRGYEEVTRSVPVFKSEPINTRGFRYRTINRSPGYVSFADRVKPMVFNKPQVESYQPGPQQPVKVAATPIPVLQGEALANSGQFRFRPDARFQPDSRFQQASLAMPQTSKIFTQKPVKAVDYQLANVKLADTIDSFSEQWSFRPADPTF